MKDPKGYIFVYRFENGVECWAKGSSCYPNVMEYVFKDNTGKELCPMCTITLEQANMFHNMARAIYDGTLIPY